MTKRTVEVPDDVAERVTAAATEHGVAPEALAGSFLAKHFPARRKVAFVSLGRSTSGRRAAEDEDEGEDEDEDMVAERFGR